MTEIKHEHRLVASGPGHKLLTELEDRGVTVAMIGEVLAEQSVIDSLVERIKTYTSIEAVLRSVT